MEAHQRCRCKSEQKQGDGDGECSSSSSSSIGNIQGIQLQSRHRDDDNPPSFAPEVVGNNPRTGGVAASLRGSQGDQATVDARCQPIDVLLRLWKGVMYRALQVFHSLIGTLTYHLLKTLFILILMGLCGLLMGFCGLLFLQYLWNRVSLNLINTLMSVSAAAIDVASDVYCLPLVAPLWTTLLVHCFGDTFSCNSIRGKRKTPNISNRRPGYGAFDEEGGGDYRPYYYSPGDLWDEDLKRGLRGLGGGGGTWSSQPNGNRKDEEGERRQKDVQLEDVFATFVEVPVWVMTIINSVAADTRLMLDMLCMQEPAHGLNKTRMEQLHAVRKKAFRLVEKSLGVSGDSEDDIAAFIRSWQDTPGASTAREKEENVILRFNQQTSRLIRSFVGVRLWTQSLPDGDDGSCRFSGSLFTSQRSGNILAPANSKENSRFTAYKVLEYHRLRRDMLDGVQDQVESWRTAAGELVLLLANMCALAQELSQDADSIHHQISKSGLADKVAPLYARKIDQGTLAYCKDVHKEIPRIVPWCENAGDKVKTLILMINQALEIGKFGAWRKESAEAHGILSNLIRGRMNELKGTWMDAIRRDEEPKATRWWRWRSDDETKAQKEIFEASATANEWESMLGARLHTFSTPAGSGLLSFSCLGPFDDNEWKAMLRKMNSWMKEAQELSFKL